MEKMNFIYFCLGALSLFVGILAQPYVKSGWQWLKSLISLRKPQQSNVYCYDLQAQINELKEQVDNVAKNNYRRESNRKSNIRREVRDYLEELRSK